MSTITTPRFDEVLLPLLASLPAAAVSPQPPAALLPHLSPILRQRVQLLSGAAGLLSTGPPQAKAKAWLPLLCYDTATVPKLEQAVRSAGEALEPHPVSGEVEVEWEDVGVWYKRLDEETLQARVDLSQLGLRVRLVWCRGDEGSDGWRVGEVSAISSSDDSTWGHDSIEGAEEQFSSTLQRPASTKIPTGDTQEAEEDDDDDYWAQYDNTTSGHRSPAAPIRNPLEMTQTNAAGAMDEDSYYNSYADVQPALDNHDPDEAAQNGTVESSLDSSDSYHLPAVPRQTTPPNPWREHGAGGSGESSEYVQVASPRPRGAGSGTPPLVGSGSDSEGSTTVQRLERKARDEEGAEMGVKVHIGTSVKSLWRLARGVGMERAEFERVVRTEMECLGLMGEEDD